MNIQISDSWLKEFLHTKATPEQIKESLSLCSQSVERIIKEGNEAIYDIEITTNRPDCLSVYGIARELSAILPRFGIPARLKEINVQKFPNISTELPLQVKIANKDLCSRFTALIFDNITIKTSPNFVQKRLNQVGIRSLNNVIDISNYLMIELGQPMHTFDYDKILKNKMILRQSIDGEEIITLDGQKRILKEGIILIEDGEGRIIDLCGIMGAKNSETDENTKRVLLFVQTYNPLKIRKACQILNFRTEAAARFERGVDEEGVCQAMERAVLLFKDWCGASVGSKLIDIYPKPRVQKTVSVTKEKVDNLIGISIKTQEIKKILDSLGFVVKINKNNISVIVPHFRDSDIEIEEDLIEEIARIYGYHNIPNILPPLSLLNHSKDLSFELEYKIKTALKYWGFTETATYSLVGRNLIDNPDNYLKLSNPLTEDLLYLRTSLIPSLLEVVKKNQTEEQINIFEMANIYLPRGNDNLPDEIMTLTILMAGDKYFHLKGVLESLLKDLGIENYEIKPEKSNNLNKYGKIYIKETNIGIIGEIINQNVVIIDIEVKKLLSFVNIDKKYIPIPKYPPIIEDLSFEFDGQVQIGTIINSIYLIDKIINKVVLIDSFKNTKTFRITYQDPEKNLTDKEIRIIRLKVIDQLIKNFSGKLRG